MNIDECHRSVKKIDLDNEDASVVIEVPVSYIVISLQESDC